MKHQVITKHLNFRVSSQKINPTNSVKYLGVYLNDSLTWTTHLTNLTPKLDRAIGLLTKIHHYTTKSQVQKLQEKALQIFFLPNTAPVNKIYKNSKILKISDYASL